MSAPPALALLLLGIAARAVCGSADPVPLVFGAVGENTTLSCLLDSVPSSFSHVSWYRQDAGGRVELLAYFSTYALAYGRYSATLSPDNRNMTLTMSNLSLSDSGHYFCVVRAALQFYPGSASALVVTDPQRAPRLELFSVQEEEEESRMVLLCEVRGWGGAGWEPPVWSLRDPKGVEKEEVGEWGWSFDSDNEFTLSSLWEQRGPAPFACLIHRTNGTVVQAALESPDRLQDPSGHREHPAPPSRHTTPPKRSVQHSATEYSSLNL
ncbi:uncharacterized protein LOC136767267 isoform X2 [Amia ocellicauda]|uniref:uncharacterized protein LOC136767267 isoform X2 n=1 Tax=Amia ocellicauda TaxID=2972642 RepID=UPI003463DDB2